MSPLAPVHPVHSPATPRPLAAVLDTALDVDVSPASRPLGLGVVVLSAEVTRDVITPHTIDVQVWGQTADLRTLELLAQLQRARRRSGLAAAIAFDVTLRSGGVPTVFALVADVTPTALVVRLRPRRLASPDIPTR